MMDDTVVVGFYGMPQQYKEPITNPNEMLGYRIAVDTNFVEKEDRSSE